MKRLLSLSSLVLLVACASNPTSAFPGGPHPDVQVALGQEFSIRVGQEASIAGTSLHLRFAAVVNDSRCPEDAVCVWAGNAEIRLDLTGSGDATRSLNTLLDPKTIEYGGRTIRLVSLLPVRLVGSATSQEDYVATLVVED